MLSRITSAVSEEGINIENLSNGSKGEYAYTIIEVDSAVEIPDKVIAKISSIEGVIRTRVI